MKKLILVLLLILLTFSCDTKKSFNKDLITGLSTSGDGLSSDTVSVLVENQKANSSSFPFGSEVSVEFKHIEGFNSENGNVFPGMSIFVVGEDKDTLLKETDVYNEYSSSGINIPNPTLYADLTLARPIHSKKRYNLFINIWDKKGDGKLSAEMNFEVIPNDKLIIEKNNCEFDEVYLYSEKNKKVINDNVIHFGDNIYLIFEGVRGFNETDGKIFCGLSLEVRDSKNETLLFYEDLFKDYDRAGLSTQDFKDRVSANFWFNGSEANNPLSLNAKLWDKSGGGYIIAQTKLTLK